MPKDIPPLSSLPLGQDDPPYSAWGLYGKDDQLGTLNRLTDEVERKFFNGVTMDDIHGEDKANVNGIQAYDAFSTGSITLEQLKAVANAQGTEIRFGDILMIRSGYINAFNDLPNAKAEVFASEIPPKLSGIEQSDEILEWLWSNFSAAAGDQPSFECWPTQREWHLHEILLSGWSMPIGELFDLEKLSEHCKKVNRWSFFTSSEVCNVPGGVASPPNILAIF
ncbi:hypothetical protein P7C71_g356, partial [Lecanoromycetidae sp. Uapishka_2]